MQRSALVVSAVAHGFLIAFAVLLAALWTAPPLEPFKPVVKLELRDPSLRIPVPVPPIRSAGGGGASPLPPRRGQPPSPRPARVFVPPTVRTVEGPKLPASNSLASLPEIELQTGPIGNPLASVAGFGDGLGNLAGMGNGTGNGIGDGGAGGFGEPVVAQSLLTRHPELIFKQEPEYSDEARMARLQGTVMLQIEVGSDGVPRNIQLIRGVGLGLDEKAMEAVSLWRFLPAMVGDMPVASPARIEVGFHLL